MISDSVHLPAPRRTILEMIRNPRTILSRGLLFGSAIGAALAVTACTTAQEQDFFNTWSSVCSQLPVGAALAVSVISNVPGLSVYSAGVTAAGSLASGVCSSVESAVSNIINQINALNGTATVTVTQTGGNTAALAEAVHSLSHRYGLRYGVRRGIASTSWTFTVAPSGAIL